MPPDRGVPTAREEVFVGGALLEEDLVEGIDNMEVHHGVQKFGMVVAGLAGAAAYYQAAGFDYGKDFGVSPCRFHGKQRGGFDWIEEFGHWLLVIDYPEFLWSVEY